MLRMLVWLDSLGYDFRSVHHGIADKYKPPPLGQWRSGKLFDSLPPFPSVQSRRR
jgi:hypothetical protein